MQNTTDEPPTEYKERQSQCLLAQLAECLGDGKKGSDIESGCQQYTEPLISNTTNSKHKPKHYTKLNYSYKLTKADDHDFWVIGECWAGGGPAGTLHKGQASTFAAELFVDKSIRVLTFQSYT